MAAREWQHADFVQYVRRFSQDSVLDAVTAASTRLAPRFTLGDELYMRTPPWALAAIVKASLCNGNPYRSAVMGYDDLLRACEMHNNIYPEELEHPDLNDPLAIMVRIGYEQFPYQESGYEELTRAEAFFNGYRGPRRLTAATTEHLVELIGAPIHEAANVALLLHAGAEINASFFDPNWLDQPNFAPVLELIPRESVIDVANTSFCIDYVGFKELDARTPATPTLAKYLFNPLVARPILWRKDGRMNAPIPMLISRRMSPLQWYYGGIERWGSDFAVDLGYMFEDYVGRQFKCLPSGITEPEVEYQRGRDRLHTTDWFIVLDDVVLLVEAKAGILPAGGRAGDASLKDMMLRTVGKAIRQLNRTHKLIITNAAELAHIPRDRPILGIVATLDPWYMANSIFGRSALPDCSIPFIVCSVREIEQLIGIGQYAQIGPILQDILGDNERSTWQLAASLGPHQRANISNPLLSRSWDRIPLTSVLSSRRISATEIPEY